jgi:cysteinyl-tRNA synthetase
MFLYNHITGKNEEITKDVLNWYCCGPTVHAETHMGHARTFIIFDSIRKYLTSIGKKVNFGFNITDIDDKIIEIRQTK